MQMRQLSKDGASRFQGGVFWIQGLESCCFHDKVLPTPLRAGELPPIMRTLTDPGKRLEGRLRKRRGFLVDDNHYNNLKPLAFVIDLIFIFSETKRVNLGVAEQVQND